MVLKTQRLTPNELNIMQDKATEAPYSGGYNEQEQLGTYLCRQCGIALFRSASKFHSGCGWPSFDGQIKENVLEIPDSDGMRTEILCARCQAHLGHVFLGEGFTAKNIRHCVNSLSLEFVTDSDVEDTQEAIVAAGCFWGVEYYFKKLPGVLITEVGYTGGHLSHPSYEDICNHASGHIEALRIVFNPAQLSYQDLVKYFFEIHDPTQVNGQGPDIGEQYLSRIYYYDADQKSLAEQVIKQLRDKNYSVATQVLPVSIFWPAENYHQDYYTKTGKQPYCHHYVKRF